MADGHLSPAWPPPDRQTPAWPSPADHAPRPPAARRGAGQLPGLRFARWDAGPDEMEMIWHCAGLDAVDAVHLDGAPLPDADWRLDPAAAELRLAAPDILHDGQPHILEAVGRHGGQRARLAVRHAARYRFTLDAAAPGRLRGFIHDEAAPGRSVHLLAEIELAPPPWHPGEAAAAGKPLPDSPPDIALAANQPTPPEIPPREGAAAYAGFEITWPSRAADGWVETVSVRVAGTGFHPFGRLRFTPAPHGGAPVVEHPLPVPFHRRQGPMRLLVVLPVRGDPRTARDAVAALRGARCRISHEILLLDVPAPGIPAALFPPAPGSATTATGAPATPRATQTLAEIAAETGCTYLDAAPHADLTAAVNAAMAVRPDHDVVLLDPTARPPAGWLDRLYRAALHPAVASVVPLEAIAAHEPPGDAAVALCERLHDGLVCPAPAAIDCPEGRARNGDTDAVGGCIYLRREALVAGGGALPLPDAGDTGLAAALALFMRGARVRGGHHVAAADLLLPLAAPHLDPAFTVATENDFSNGHAGGDIDPAAHELATSALRRPRNRLRVALWQRDLDRDSPNAQPLAVLVTHALPGGTSRHVDRLDAALREAGHAVLWLQPSAADGGVAGNRRGQAGLRLHDPRSGATCRYPADRDGLDEALADVFALTPAFVHVHHLTDLPDGLDRFLRGAGIPYVVTLHDYFFGCPRATLLDEGGGFCGAPAAHLCAPCLDAGGAHTALHPDLVTLAGNATAWREKWGRFLAGATQRIAPSAATATLIARLFPELPESGDIVIRPHPGPLKQRPERAPYRRAAAGTPDGERARIRVAVIGTIGPHQGSDRLHDLARHALRSAPDLHFVVVGHTDRDAQLRACSNVEIFGPYLPDEAQATIAAADCDVALFLSTFPETYGFELSEALRAGLEPVACDIGALGERLRLLERGVLVNPGADAATLVGALRTAAAGPQRPPPTTIDGDYPALMTSYYAALPAPAASQFLIGQSSGLTPDLWCARRLRLSLYARPALRTISLRFWHHPDHLALGGMIWADGGTPQRFWSEPDSVLEVTLPLASGSSCGHGARIVIATRFDTTTPLDPPDLRTASVKLIGLSAMTVARQQYDYHLQEHPPEGTDWRLTLPTPG